MFDGCSKEWGATSAVWGAQYGGPSSNTCPSFPKALQPGCGFRWGWMKGADNPTLVPLHPFSFIPSFTGLPCLPSFS